MPPDLAAANSTVGAVIDDEALSFGQVASLYDRIRPSYPADALRWAVGEGRHTAVDLGAGTGLLTRVLAPLVTETIAVEPDDGMRERLLAVTPGITAVAGSAESMPLPDSSVDAVVAGQSYHWFDHEKAHREIARVLRPGGILAAVWNLRDERVEWVRELTGVLEPIRPRDSAVYLHWESPDFGAEFGRVERGEWSHSIPMDAGRLVELVRSRSYYLVAAADRRAELEAQVSAVAAILPERFELPYRTVVYRAVKR
jgi:SAM-dependent methyltransferase